MKVHLVTDGRGLAVLVTVGQANDALVLAPLLDTMVVPRLKGGPPRRNPRVVIADKAYSSAADQPYVDPVGPEYRLLERLPRASGTVTLWRHDDTSGRTDITVRFDDSQRSQCRIDSFWTNHSVDELIDWWRSAPL